MFQLNLGFLWPEQHRSKPVRPVHSARTPLSFVWKHDLVVNLVTSPIARRYLLRLKPDGSVRLVIPERRSRAEGMRFLERSEAWLLKQRARWMRQDHLRQPWQEGTRFLFRGEEVSLHVKATAAGLCLCFADQTVLLSAESGDYREAVFAHLRQVATRELPPLTREMALKYGVTIHHVTVRDQKTRWGSCSSRGTISLNWRIIQAPAQVRDYLIVHELMHRREMNHSSRYWQKVAEAFPDYREAEAWLKKTRLESLG